MNTCNSTGYNARETVHRRADVQRESCDISSEIQFWDLDQEVRICVIQCLIYSSGVMVLRGKITNHEW